MNDRLSVKNSTEGVISLGTMHPGQIKAYWALKPHRYKILRCGRRFGKTEFAKIWIGQGYYRAGNAPGLHPNIRSGRKPTWRSKACSVRFGHQVRCGRP